MRRHLFTGDIDKKNDSIVALTLCGMWDSRGWIYKGAIDGAPHYNPFYSLHLSTIPVCRSCIRSAKAFVAANKRAR